MSGILAGKICLVTGAGSGIGRATVIEMLKEGAATVIAADVDVRSAEETADLATRHDWGHVQAVEVDVTDEGAVASMMTEIDRRHGKLDVLHNNAGIVEAQGGIRASLEDCTERMWDKVFAVNVKGTWLCSKLALPLLRKSHAGAIVNCGSVSGQIAVAGESVYGASKAAVIQLTRSLAADLASDGIRVNCYCPAAVDTRMTRDEDATKLQIDSITSRYLICRLASPTDVSNLVCFLASEKASFITGSVFSIDGGMLAWPGPRGAIPND